MVRHSRWCSGKAVWASRACHGLVIILAVLVCSGCAFTQSPFARSAQSAGAAFAAAAATLRYEQHGRATPAYTASAFVNYQSELAGVDQTLPQQTGAPDRAALRRLLALYRPAYHAVQAPCLDHICAWRAQLAALDAASKAFLEASER